MSRVPGGAGFGPNVTLVKAGQSVATAVTAAAAAYAAGGVPQVVLAMPGAVWDNLDATPKGVSIIPFVSLLRPREPFVIQSSLPMVAYLSDDIVASDSASAFGWWKNHADLDFGAGDLGTKYGVGQNLKPMSYLHNVGMPVSHGIITGLIGTVTETKTRFSMAQIRDAFWACGHAFHDHSKTHGVVGVGISAGELLGELLGSREVIERLGEDGWGTGATVNIVSVDGGGAITAVDMAGAVGGSGYYVGDRLTLAGGNGAGKVDVASISGTAITGVTLYSGGATYRTGVKGTSYTGIPMTEGYPSAGAAEFCYRPGLRVQGFSVPGDFYSFADPATVLSNLFEDKVGNFGQLIDALYSWCVGWYGSVRVEGMHGWPIRGFGVSGRSIDSVLLTDADIANMLTPGARYLFWGDHPGTGTLGSMAIWKSNIDKLIVARDAGQLLLVTVNALFDAIQVPMTGYCGVPNGTFESMAAANLPTVQSFGGWYTAANGDAAIVAAGGNPTHYLSIAPTKFAVTIANLEPGGIYALSYDAKYIAPGDSGSIRLKLKHETDTVDGALNAELLQTTSATDRILTGSWQNFTNSFGVPWWAAQTQLMIYNLDAADTVGIDNVKLLRIG